MMEAHVMEELSNIVTNGPVFPGDTISHATADECVRRGWAMRNGVGDFMSMPEGKRALRDWIGEPRDAD